MTDPTPERWSRVRNAFDAVVDVSPEDRAAALEAACVTPTGDLDDALRLEVEAMLAADDHASVLDESVPAGLVEDEPSAAGEEFGRWRVEREIGRGGMGAVYLVERADGAYDQTAALKRLSLFGSEGVRQFERERQILAGLEHPGIARLLDGGVRDDVPYLVMEYVEGEPITVFARERGLEVEDRIRLFVQVCEAVGYAHRHLVVHRDLKPGNVFVTERERGGLRPVLLDFGIAKMLDVEGDAALTRTVMPHLSPEYAAPEQVTGDPVTTATDVYALGVLLYELLAQERPYTIERPTLTQIVEAVVETQPVRPSSKAAPEIQRVLRGDLDTVVMKALDKDPARRYNSADDLADDLRRYLQGLPVRAQTPSLSYRAKRFVGRHRVSVAASALAVCMLVAGTAFYTVRLAAERDRAEQAAAEAEAVSETIISMFDRDPFAADPERMDTVSVGQFVIERGASVVSDLQDHPEVQVRLLPLLARLHGQLGDSERALSHARRAVLLVDSLGTPPSASALRAYTEIGTALEGQGEYEEAIAYFRRALTLSDAIHGREHQKTAVALGDLGNALANVGDSASVAEAIVLGEEALSVAQRVHGPDHVDVALAHNNLGTYLYTADRPEDALPHVRRALMIRRSALGDHPLVANAESNLASFLRDLGRHQEAVGQYDTALRTYRTTLGSDHPLLAAPLYGLAVSLRELGRLEDAERSAREALTRDAAALPDEHPFLAYDHELVGEILALQMRWPEAERHLRRAVALYGPDADDATLADAHAALGRVTARTGRQEEAERLLSAARPHVSGARLTRVEADLADLR